MRGGVGGLLRRGIFIPCLYECFTAQTFFSGLPGTVGTFKGRKFKYFPALVRTISWSDLHTNLSRMRDFQIPEFRTNRFIISYAIEIYKS